MTRHTFAATTLLIAILLCAFITKVQAQQSDLTSAFETAAAKAKAIRALRMVKTNYAVAEKLGFGGPTLSW